MAKTVNEYTGEVCYSKGERLASAQRYFEQHPEDESINFLVYGREPDIYCTIWNEWHYQASAKKSKPATFNDMVQKQRQGQLKKNLSSVGASYPLDYDRISNEMVEIAMRMRQHVNDYVDVGEAYEQWERENYDIDLVDEDGDKTYDDKLWDMVETKINNYDRKKEQSIMNEVYDLEYNDLVEFGGYGQFYVKSTNGNDSYNGCKIWAGPDKDDDSGWYFYASDFVEVVTPSHSGESIFGF